MPIASAKDIILQILRAGDGEWTGKKRLFKAFYFAHLYYANCNPGLLTDWPIARMPEGPGIDKADTLIGGLTRDNCLTVELIHEGPYPEYRYRLTENGKAAPPPTAAAQEAVKQAAEFCVGKRGGDLSRLTHDHSRSWKMGKDGDILNIYIDAIPDEEYEQRAQEIERLEQLAASILEG